jgi:hypothetical protein
MDLFIYAFHSKLMAYMLTWHGYHMILLRCKAPWNVHAQHVNNNTPRQLLKAIGLNNWPKKTFFAPRHKPMRLLQHWNASLLKSTRDTKYPPIELYPMFILWCFFQPFCTLHRIACSNNAVFHVLTCKKKPLQYALWDPHVLLY